MVGEDVVYESGDVGAFDEAAGAAFAVDESAVQVDDEEEGTGGG